MRVGVVGSGQVGRVLADGLLQHDDYEVMWASRDPAKLEQWRAAAGEHASVGTFEEAARWAHLVILCVKGTAAEDVVRMCGPENLVEKTVIDATNPIADDPPDGAVLKFFTTLDESLMERLQRVAPDANFVKCFSSVGNSLMVHPDLPGGPPTMFMCGDDAWAKEETQEILRDFGWEWEDLGGAAAARAIEPLCILWCIPGFLHGDWARAYKVLRPRS